MSLVLKCEQRSYIHCVCVSCVNVCMYLGVEFSDAYFNQSSFLEYNPLALSLER